MSSPESSDYSQDLPQAPSAKASLLADLESRKSNILSFIKSFLATATVSEVDRSLVEAAVTYIENPTNNLKEIMEHARNIGQISCDYDINQEPVPSEIDELNVYLLSLHCVNLIIFVEEELKQASPDMDKIKEAMRQALDWSKTLARPSGYNYRVSLTAVNELQGRPDLRQ